MFFRRGDSIDTRFHWTLQCFKLSFPLFKGNTFEKVGITTAIIEGQLPPQAIKMITAKENDLDANNTKFYSVSKYF